jgi:hypothetical protein
VELRMFGRVSRIVLFLVSYSWSNCPSNELISSIG